MDNALAIHQTWEGRRAPGFTENRPNARRHGPPGADRALGLPVGRRPAPWASPGQASPELSPLILNP